MSTFRGLVDEFPDIRIDFFRPICDRRTPLACFLSHVHSDHLVGLENKTFHGKFLYCSPATREILLRLQKYPHRLNFAKGILESEKLTYKHLKDRLKTIPLETPTVIELEPGNEILVTLFNANHCIGAVMFLIEGDGKAILYTGDIRSEPWFVNNLTRNPFLIEYTCGLKKLDCLYLDTSNTNPISFPAKADGLQELLQKVSKYPVDTVFHFEAWTFGYEEVWIAMSRALKSQIHVDEYKMHLYKSLRGSQDSSHDTYLSGPFLAHEGPALTGYKCGNTPQVGCLTDDKNARIHSCEKGMHCEPLKKNTVWIRPIIARTKHGEIAEVGVGGGGGDLTRRPELEVESEHMINEFLGLFGNTDELVKMDIRRMLLDGFRSNRTALLLNEISLDEKDLPITKLTEVLARSTAEKRGVSLNESPTDKGLVQTESLPRVITFPYSRHSSYEELCHLVKVFNPKDVYPCTVDEENWDEDVSMKELFGQECSATRFRHDDEMRELHAECTERLQQYTSQQTHTTVASESSQMLPLSSPVQRVAQNSKSNSVTVRRNLQGQLRPFDADCNEVLPRRFGDKLLDVLTELTPHILHSTPPQKIVARSPGSESQNLRRKAIDDARGEGPVKRPRLQTDSPASSPPTSSSIVPSTPGRREQSLAAVFEEYKESDAVASIPGSDADTPQGDAETAAPIIDLSSVIVISDEEESQFEDDPYERDWDDGDYEVADNNYVDNVDNIVRCRDCGHEVWAVWMTRMGFCTHCNTNGHIEPYFEIINPEAGPCPEINGGEFAEELRGDDRLNIVGDYIDEDYDTQDEHDEKTHFQEDYDVEDTFIDDASIHDSESRDEGVSSSDGETDHKQRFDELQARYNRLLTSHLDLADTHDEIMRDILGSQYGGSDEDDFDTENMDEEGALLVPINNPDPTVAELVLSQAQEQSQDSEISADRLLNRVRAFEAADGGNGWQYISLVSTGDNHTHEEIEL